jgi:NAD(P)-dependent dehydrogenase (short-subunit alcohol dehydrogenase family)
MELAGRTALVTGGSSDIGAAIAWGLARRGADVAIHYHHNGERAEALVTEVLTLGRRSAAVGGDLASSDDVKRVAAEVASEGIASLSAFPMRRTSSRSSPDTM